MAEVTYCSAKHDGESFEAGTPASELPKVLRESMRQNGLLIPGPKAEKAEKPKKAIVSKKAVVKAKDEE